MMGILCTLPPLFAPPGEQLRKKKFQGKKVDESFNIKQTLQPINCVEHNSFKPPKIHLIVQEKLYIIFSSYARIFF